MSASSSTGCGMSTSIEAYLCWRPCLPAKAAARLAAWSSSPCRISPQRCGRLSGVWSAAWTSSNAVNWSSRSTATCTSGGPTSPVSDPGLRLGDLSDEQLEPALDLLQLFHSVRGWSDTQLVIRIEAVRRELSLQQAGLALQEDQRRIARIAVKAPADIASRWDPVAALPEQPRGVPYARLDRLQRELFVSLLRQYVDRAASAVANQAWTDITDAGLDQVCFGWAGPVERGAGHYYALSGPSLLIEYDNTQDKANHIHSVWRDLRRDFAGDLLAQHYADMRH